MLKQTRRPSYACTFSPAFQDACNCANAGALWGQNSDEVLAEIGLTSDQIATLRDKGSFNVALAALCVPILNNRLVEGAATRGADAVVLDLEAAMPQDRKTKHGLLCRGVSGLEASGADIAVQRKPAPFRRRKRHCHGNRRGC